MNLWDWIKCNVLQDHDWTCDAAKGIPPTKEQVDAGLDGFWLYARSYCARCGKELKP